MRRALAIDETVFGKGHPDVARDLNNLALLLKATNRLAEAEPLMRRALAIVETSFGKDHSRTAVQLNNLAQFLNETDRPDEAEPLMRRALAIDEAVFGEDHPDVARDANNLALLLYAADRFVEAEPLMSKVLQILGASTAATGHLHPNLGSAIVNYDALLCEMGDTQARERIAVILDPIRDKLS
jgi:tetratricopeptide (TPR) repeat protein